MSIIAIDYGGHVHFDAIRQLRYGTNRLLMGEAIVRNSGTQLVPVTPGRHEHISRFTLAEVENPLPLMCGIHPGNPSFHGDVIQGGDIVAERRQIDISPSGAVQKNLAGVYGCIPHQDSICSAYGVLRIRGEAVPVNDIRLPNPGRCQERGQNPDS